MSKNRTILILIFVIVLANVILYARTAHFTFTDYDDTRYIRDNHLIRELDANGVKAIFSQFYFANYQPLVLLSYAVDYSFYGLDAGGYHITNTVLHILNSILVLLLIYAITKNIWVAFLVALFFSIHPMQAQSVAWISERKGLLCALFFFLSFLSYIRFSRGGRRGFYFLCLVLFVFALLSKPMAVTLPVILILFDYYEDKLTREKLLSMIPFLLLSALSVIVTIKAQQYDNSFVAASDPSYPNPLFAFYSIWFYIAKLIAPLDMYVKYQYPPNTGILSMRSLTSVLVFAALIIYLIKIKRIKREVNFGILFFLITLLPVLRFVPIGDSFAAERYVYMPIVGLFFAIVVFGEAIIARYGTMYAGGKFKTAAVILLSVYILLLGIKASGACNIWRDKYSVWRNTLEHEPNNLEAMYAVGSYYMEVVGDYKKARQHFSKSMLYDKKREESVYNMSLTYVYERNYPEAEKHLTMLVFEGTENAEIYLLLGAVYSDTNRLDEAIDLFKKSITLDPESAKAHYNYGVMLEGRGEIDKALEQYKIASEYAGDWKEPLEAVKDLTKGNKE